MPATRFPSGPPCSILGCAFPDLTPRNAVVQFSRQNRDEVATPGLSAKSTGASAVSRGAETAIFVPSCGPRQSGFDEELRRLLRGRLLLIHLLALALILLLTAMMGLTPTAEQVGVVQVRESHFWARLAAQFAEATIATFALSRFSGMTLRSLRIWELAFFITYAAAAGLNRFEVLASPIEGAAGNVPALAMGFNDLTSLQGFIILILAYGVLIPNTRRRSLLLVAALTAVPLAIVPAAAVANPLLHEGRVLALIAQSCALPDVPGGHRDLCRLPRVYSSAAGLRGRAAGRANRPIHAEAETRRRHHGEVWLAEHRLLKWPCAAEFIRPELAATPRDCSPLRAGGAGGNWIDPPQHRAGVRLRPGRGRFLLLCDGVSRWTDAGGSGPSSRAIAARSRRLFAAATLWSAGERMPLVWSTAT